MSLGRRNYSREYEILKNELKARAYSFHLTSKEVVKASKKMDKYIVKIMRRKVKENKCVNY